MIVFNIIAGLCSIAGLVISAFTLATTRTTKSQLQLYKSQVKINERLSVLKGVMNSLFVDQMQWTRGTIQTCKMETNYLIENYRGEFKDNTIKELTAFYNRLTDLRRNLDNQDLQEDLKYELQTIVIKIEKEMTNYAGRSSNSV